MGDVDPPPRRRSDVLDAILDQVVDSPERSAAASTIFRPTALARLDVAAEIDNQLPLVARRDWLMLAGVVAVVLGLGLWAGLTPSVTSVSATGRVVADPGVLPVETGQAGVLVGDLPAAGSSVTPGQVVGRLRSAGGTVEVRAATAGTVWQVLGATGAALSVGDPLVTLLPPGSGRSLQVVLPEQEAARVAVGQQVLVAGRDGRVSAVSAPVPADVARARTGLDVGAGQQVLVSVALPAPLPPGAAVPVQIIESARSVLDRLRGRS